MADQDLLIPDGNPISAKELAQRLNLELYDNAASSPTIRTIATLNQSGLFDELRRMRLRRELDAAMNESGVSRDLLRLIQAKRNGR